MHKNLFIPGPIEVKADVLEKMATPNISLMFALDYQLDKIFEEGIENRFARHLQMAKYTRNWAKKYFDLFTSEDMLL